MPRKLTKKDESGAREAVRAPASEQGSAPPTSTRSRDLASRGERGEPGELPSAWLDRLLAAVVTLPLEDGQRAVVTSLVDTLAALLPDHAVGACFVPEPGSASHGQVVERRMPAGSVVAPPGVDPTRVFPALSYERVIAVPGSTTGSTLHVASDVDALDATESPVVRLVDRAAMALGHALHVSRQLTSPGPGPRDSHDFDERMIQADKLATFGQIAAGIVHELNNPLTSIVAYSDFLIRRAVSGPEPRDPDDVDRLRRISESANRMLRFTRDFVAYARPSSGVAGPVILHGVVDQAVAFCEHVLSQSGVSIDRRYAPDVMTVRGVSEQLVQVFVNLLTNASQAAPAEGGRIVITTSIDPSSRDAVVVVEDNGAGIAPEHLRQVFLPFFTTKSDRDGTGLGLSIVKSIVDGHDGRIHVESPPGSGARFVIALPSWHRA
jgi:signal transduction histidine kinase